MLKVPADTEGEIIIGGIIWEHVEEAGVHSGDSVVKDSSVEPERNVHMELQD